MAPVSGRDSVTRSSSKQSALVTAYCLRRFLGVGRRQPRNAPTYTYQVINPLLALMTVAIERFSVLNNIDRDPHADRIPPSSPA